MRRVLPLAILLLAVIAANSLPRSSSRVAATTQQSAQFDADGRLKLPEGYRHWVFVGAPLTPNGLNNGQASFPEYHHVYVEEKNLDAYLKTGSFPEGTVIVKELTRVLNPTFPDGSRSEPSGRGYFNGQYNGLDVTVKDSKRFAATNGWGFFNFGHHPLPYSPWSKEASAAECAGLPSVLCRQDRHDLGSVLPDSAGRRQNQIVWITRGRFRRIQVQTEKLNHRKGGIMSKSTGMSNGRGGHLYMQTNEIKNAVVHYGCGEDGKITEVERSSTGGAGSGPFKPISGQESAPNAFEGAGSVILSPDRRFLFTTNGGDNSVSSFTVAGDGRLTLLDRKPTGNPVEGRSGTAKSLAFAPSTGILYVLHSFGPDHLRLMSVDGQGKLTARNERYTVNTQDKTDRIPTMVILSPDGKFLLVGTTFDLPIAHVGLYPDGSPILWVPQPDGTYKVIASNAPDPDGLIVFPLREDGTPGPAKFQDAKGASPFYITFLHHRPDTFVIGYAVEDGCAIATLNGKGEISVGPVVKIDTRAGLPSELCWLSVSPDDGFVFATHFGYSYISSYRLNAKGLEIANDPACPKVPGDGTARGLNTTVTSGPADSWVTPDGAFLYQIYGNASKLVGYATHPDGSLKEVTSLKIPYNSPQGLAGF